MLGACRYEASDLNIVVTVMLGAYRYEVSDLNIVVAVMLGACRYEVNDLNMALWWLSCWEPVVMRSVT